MLTLFIFILTNTAPLDCRIDAEISEKGSTEDFEWGTLQPRSIFSNERVVEYISFLLTFIQTVGNSLAKLKFRALVVLVVLVLPLVVIWNVYRLDREAQRAPPLPKVEEPPIVQSSSISGFQDSFHREIVKALRSIYDAMPDSPGRKAFEKFLMAVEGPSQQVPVVILNTPHQPRDDMDDIPFGILEGRIIFNYQKFLEAFNGNPLLVEIQVVGASTRLDRVLKDQEMRRLDKSLELDNLELYDAWNRLESDETFRQQMIRLAALYFEREVEATRAEIPHLIFIYENYPVERKALVFRDSRLRPRIDAMLDFVLEGDGSINEKRLRLFELDQALKGGMWKLYYLLFHWDRKKDLPIPLLHPSTFMGRDEDGGELPPSHFFWKRFPDGIRIDIFYDPDFMPYLFQGARQSGPLRIPGAGTRELWNPPDRVEKIRNVREALEASLKKNPGWKTIPIYSIKDEFPEEHQNDFAYPVFDGRGRIQKILIRAELLDAVVPDDERKVILNILRRHEMTENVVIPELIQQGILRAEDRSYVHAITSAVDASIEGSSLHALMMKMISVMSNNALLKIQPNHPNDPAGDVYRAAQDEWEKRMMKQEQDMRELALRLREQYLEIQGVYGRYRKGETFDVGEIHIQDEVTGEALSLEKIEELELKFPLAIRGLQIVDGYCPYLFPVHNMKGVKPLSQRQGLASLAEKIRASFEKSNAPVLIHLGGRPGSGRKLTSVEIDYFGLTDLITPDEIGVIHASRFNHDQVLVEDEISRLEQKGKKVIFVEGEHDGLFDGRKSNLRYDLHVYFERDEPSRLGDLYHSRRLEIFRVLRLKKIALQADIEPHHRRRSLARLTRYLEREMAQFISKARLENFIHRYTLDQERRTADIIIQYAEVEFDRGRALPNRAELDRLKPLIQAACITHDTSTLVELLIQWIQTSDEYGRMLRLEEEIQRALGLDQLYILDRDPEALKYAFEAFFELDGSHTFLMDLFRDSDKASGEKKHRRIKPSSKGTSRKLMRVAASGESSDDEEGNDGFTMAEMRELRRQLGEAVFKRAVRILRNADFRRLGIPKVLNGRVVPRTLSKEHRNIARVLPFPRKTFSLGRHVKIGSQTFDTCRIEVCAVDLGRSFGFSLSSVDRPIYSWSSFEKDKDQQLVLRVYVTEAFLRLKHEKSSWIMTQALIHTLVETLSRRDHLEALQHEVFYNQRSIEGLTQEGENSNVLRLSHFIKWRLEEAARERNWQYLVRLTKSWPYAVKHQHHALDSYVEGTAYELARLLILKAWELLLENPDLISTALSQMGDGAEKVVFLKELKRRGFSESGTDDVEVVGTKHFVEVSA